MQRVIETDRGRLEGREGAGVRLFAGIPFAAPPIGERRWALPAAHAGWTGVRPATTFAKPAMQPVGAMELLTGAPPPDWREDCLALNVVTPACDGARRPVLVWIHGGSFVTGSGGISWYDGTSMATTGDVVVVTINYRLGALGWLHLGEVDDDLAGSGNCGLADQVLALRWVRDNIEAFGGDPGNVTVFGESAGAMSVGTLLATPSVAGLFHKAILQSGAAHNVVAVDQAAEVADRLLAALGVRDVAAARAIDAVQVLDAQIAVTAALTTERAARNRGGALGLTFGPVIDGHLLFEDPLAAIASGSAADVPLLTGTTAEEWKLFGLTSSSVEDDATIERRLARSTPNAEELAAAYRADMPDATPQQRWTAVLTDQVFRLPAIRLLEAQRKHQPDHTFAYRFEFASTAMDGLLGSCHALEIPFVFDTLDKPGVAQFTGPDAPRDLAVTMRDAWTSFARTGRPIGGGVVWPPYGEARSTMVLDHRVGVVDDPLSRTRAAWHWFD